MDIRNIGKTDIVDRPSDRPKRADGARDYVLPAMARDEARISDSSRETAAAVDGLSGRARSADGDRQAKVAAAKQKLLDGELDTPAVQLETARRLLGAKFTSI